MRVPDSVLESRLQDWEESVIDRLLAIPKEELTIRSHPQYSYLCSRCGHSVSSTCREDVRAVKEIHRPRVQNPEGRGFTRIYNCRLRPVPVKDRKGRQMTIWVPIREAIRLAGLEEGAVESPSLSAMDKLKEILDGRSHAAGAHPSAEEGDAAGNGPEGERDRAT